MTNFHYSLPESEPSSSYSGLSNEARMALTKVAMGPSAASQLLNPEGSALFELEPDFQEVTAEAHRHLVDIFAYSKLDLSVPSLDSQEFSQVNWLHLQEGFRVYESLDMQPELVISPEGQPIDFWKGLYAGLRLWQDRAQPDAQHRIQKQDDGDGLFIADTIMQNWSSIKASSPGWKVSIIPGTPTATALNVDHRGNDDTGTIAGELAAAINALPAANGGLPHPSAESYLTLQAKRLLKGEEPIDTKIGGLYYWSWLDGAFTTVNNNKQVSAAPYGGWYPDSGQVRLFWDGVGYRDGGLGARPEVRG